MKSPLLKAAQRRFWRAYVRGASQLHDLTYLFWETTLRCNLACRHCGSGCGPSAGLPGELGTAEVKRVFDTIAEDFDPRKITVAVTGGEPLLRPDVFEVAAHFAKKGFRWGMVTNALLLTDRALELCIGTGMGSVAISLDGLKEHHEYLRGSGTFAPTIAAIKKYRPGGFTGILEVVTCPTPKMVYQLDAVYDLMCSLGLDSWRLIPLAPIGRVREHPELRLSGAELKLLLDWLRAKRAQKQLPLKVMLDEEGYLGEPYEREVRDLPYFCFAGVHAAALLADGSVGPCPSVDRSFVQGNIKERRFGEIWEQEFKLFRDRRWMARGKCQGCKSFADCLGNSFHLWDSPKAQGPACCHLEMLAEADGSGK